MVTKSGISSTSIIQISSAVLVVVLTAVYLTIGLSSTPVIDTSELPSTAQVSNRAVIRNLKVEASGSDNCESGSLQTGTQVVPQASDQATASPTQGNSGVTQASPLTGQLQSRDSCNHSTQSTPLQPAGSKTDFEQFDSAN